MNETLRNMAPLFEGMDKRNHAFKRETYADTFQSYREENGGFFRELNQALAAGQQEELSRELAGAVTGYVKETLGAVREKRKREAAQLNYNMFMAVYFMPAILEGKQNGARELTDSICAKWAETFHGSRIQSADFATIQSGFRTKLCYITTAVCKSLHKPEDCRELELLRGYRDGYLLRHGGAALVEEYYDIAPTIVKRIGKSPDAGSKYRYLWERYLKPCVAAIENGNSEACGEIYAEMVEELKRQYVVTAGSHMEQQRLQEEMT